MKHVAVIMLGPVQDLIAQARRTRDLWFGSHLLSEVSRAAARELYGTESRRSTLVFPAIDDASQLEPCDELLRPEGHPNAGEPPLAVPNRVVAIVPDGVDLEELLEAARDAAFDRWRDLACKAGKAAESEGILADGIDDVWKEQIESLLEFYGAALPLPDEQEYEAVRRQVDAVIAARKNLREFGQVKHHRPGARKSTFDGGRVSVLKKPEDRPARTRWRIAPGEALDAVGIVKRCGGEPEQYVPMTNVAVGRWIDAVQRGAADVAERTDVADALDALESTAEDFGRVVRDDLPVGKCFKGDAQLLFEDRARSLVEELQPLWGADRVRERTVQIIDEQLRPLQSAVRNARGQMPHPYVATLVADGDRMGAALSELHDVPAQQRFSRLLSEFADKARKIVEQDHFGSLIYAGGDDVLGIVPLPDAVACADSLQQEFGDLMAKALEGHDVELPTLSVGIGIGHILMGMGELLDLGRKAEKVAKGDTLPEDQQRNALAIVLDKRGGGQVSWRRSWADAVDQMKGATRRIARDEATAVLPLTKLHQVRRMMRELPDPRVREGSSSAWASTLQLETHRVLLRSGRGLGDSRTPADFGLPAPWSPSYREAHRELDAWVALHLIAKELNVACVGPWKDVTLPLPPDYGTTHGEETNHG